MRETWEKIIKFLDKAKPKWKEEIDDLGQINNYRRRQNKESFSDEELFEGVALGILSRGADYRSIHSNREVIKKVFNNYDLSGQQIDLSSDDLKKISSKLAGRFTDDNIKNVLKSSKKLKEIIHRHKSIDLFISNVNNNNSVQIIRNISSSNDYKLSGVGEVIASEIIKNWGFSAVKADQHILRAYAFLGWLDVDQFILSENPQYSYPRWTSEINIKVEETTKKLSYLINEPIVFIDNVIWYICAKYGCHLTNKEIAANFGVKNMNSLNSSSYLLDTISSDNVKAIDVNDIEKYLNRIELLKMRKDSGCFNNLNKGQQALYRIMKNKQSTLNRNLKRIDIEPEFNRDGFKWASRECVITDFCYNKVNMEDNPNKFIYSPVNGLFQFVDFNWVPDSDKEIKWAVKNFGQFEVGIYNQKGFQWDFDLIEMELANIIY